MGISTRSPVIRRSSPRTLAGGTALDDMPTRYVMVPGLRGSGPEHWQSLWESELGDVRRVLQDDPETPDVERWSAAVARMLDFVRSPAIVIAHGFGCLAAIRAVTHFHRPVAALLLVAPIDPGRLRVVQSSVMQSLDVPATLVASSDDPWMRLTTAAYLAKVWHARFVACPGAGHINAESGHGPWPEGRTILKALVERSRGAFASGVPAGVQAASQAARWR